MQAASKEKVSKISESSKEEVSKKPRKEVASKGTAGLVTRPGDLSQNLVSGYNNMRCLLTITSSLAQVLQAKSINCEEKNAVLLGHLLRLASEGDASC